MSTSSLKTIPEFDPVPSTDGEFSVNSLRGAWTVLYFYPRDFTGGCTLEGQDFAASYTRFESAGYRVLGVSPDDLESHERFRDSLNLPYPLVSDLDEEVAEAFEVFQLDANGITGETVRSTFIIDPELNIVHSWVGVSAAGHVADVVEWIGEHS